MLEIQRKYKNSFYILLSLPATAMGYALCIQIATLSWMLSAKYNLDIHEVGYVWAAGPLAGIIGQLLIGFISDKVWFWGGRRRPFILIGGITASLMLFCLPNLDKIASAFGIGNMIILALVVSLLLDLAINISFNPTRSLIADVTPLGKERTKGYTWMQTISGAFGVMAYGIGAIFGNSFLIYSGIGIVLFLTLIPTFLITEPALIKEELNIESEKKVLEKFDFELIKIYVANAFTWLGVQSMFVFMFAFIKHKMNVQSDEEAGKIISIAFLILNTVGFILPAALFQPLSKKIKRVIIHAIALGIMAFAYSLMVFYGSSPTITYCLMALAGIGWAATVSLPFAIMTEKIQKQKMGLFMGIFNLSIVIPQLLSSLVIGKIIEAYEDKSILFVICAVSLFISMLIWFNVKEASKINSFPKT
jgi:MFS family permease